MSDTITTREHTIWCNDPDEIYAIMDDMNSELEPGVDPYTYNDAAELCDEYRFDEITNLESANGGKILAIADLGLWDGRHTGYKILDKLTDVLSDLPNYYAYIRFYVDENGEFCGRVAHHDGTNYITYRERRPDCDENAWDELLDKIYNSDDSYVDLLDVCTIPLGKKIQAIYGWIS